MVKKLKQPKAVSYTVISQTSDIGIPMYELLYSIIDQFHDELSRTNVRIVLAWAISWKADVDGRLVLGKCKKASDLDRELAPFDFVILLNRDFWQNPRVTEQQRLALLDHELMHAAVAYDENGDAKCDERGRTVYRLRKHDLEEFSAIASRHGCWKRDIEAFAQALRLAEQQTTGWVGYASLHETLKANGVYSRLDVVDRCAVPDLRFHQASVYDVRKVFTGSRFRLIVADPPYTAQDAKRYQAPMVNKRRAVAALAEVAAPGGFLAWLDTSWPQHRKSQWKTVGRILIQRSTNHRVRVLNLFERCAA